MGDPFGWAGQDRHEQTGEDDTRTPGRRLGVGTARLPGVHFMIGNDTPTRPNQIPYRRPVGPDRAAAAACGQHRWPRRSPRGPSPPPSAGCDLLPGCRRDRLGRAAPRVPAAPDRVRPVPALGHSRCLAADPRRPPRPGSAARRPGARTDRGDHRLAIGARRRHRSHHKPRLRRRQEGQRPQTTHRGRHQRSATGRRGHHCRHPGPRRRAAPAGRAAGPVQHHQPRRRRGSRRRCPGWC